MKTILRIIIMTKFPALVLLPIALPLVLLTQGLIFAQSSDTGKEHAEAAWQQTMEDFENAFDDISEETGDNWDRIMTQQDENWEAYKSEIEKKWDGFLSSTKKIWVDYSPTKDSRSVVDFENGSVEIETIVPVDTPKSEEKVKEEIKRQLNKAFSDKNAVGENVLRKQIEDKEGRPITERNIENYIEKEVLPRITVEEKPYTAKDGTKRLKYKVTISLVPDHLHIRAQRYLPLITRYGNKFGIDPQLVLAVIHTESYFNPMAASDRGAIGLMQIIPQYAGKDAYMFIYNKDIEVAPSYLYSPDNNIKLGTAYLSLLKRKYFSEIGVEPNNRYITICGYNWGPGAVKRKIIDTYDVRQMNAPALFKLLRQKTPKETSDYLKRVTERIPMYAQYLERL